MRLYFAGPLFCASERHFNDALSGQIQALGYSVFLPQRDGVESSKEPYASMSADERRAAMFQMDRDEIFAADAFLFVLDGRVPDEGACVELGLAHANRIARGTPRHLIGLQTDIRAAFLRSHLNPMLSQALDEVVTDVPTLLKRLTDLQESQNG